LVLQQAITAASSYIYVEDQTLNPDPVYRQYGSHDLLYPTIRAACAKGVKVMFVTDGFAGSDSPRQANLTMSSEINDLILSPLTADQRTNFTLHVVTGTKVHSKVVLIDDEFALIGSANFWDRSMTGVESEVSAAIVHPGRNASLVADLRVRLWCGHLRVAPTSPGVEADLRDLRKSLGVFRKSWGTDVGFPHQHSALKEIVP
jgi:phosphatidylserine/phosphatidylglycerophosphate/cardiolipin synthase-like enzyme